MSLPRSPLAPARLPDPRPIPGVSFFAGSTGQKYVNRDDIFGALFAPGTVAAGSFTKNQVVGAPVEWTRAALGSHAPTALVVNAGNANVANGQKGLETVERIAMQLSSHLNCDPQAVWQSSTGVIGEYLDPEPMVAACLALVDTAGPDMGAAARAFLTTDTFEKTVSANVNLSSGPVAITGMAKGSGMVQPNMATMLAFAFTDAKIDQEKLQEIHSRAIDLSFNAITVDSDTSTSDMALTFATGLGSFVTGADEVVFETALTKLYIQLAQLVVRDGEGATKFIAVKVSGAANEEDAKIVAMSIANSPLVKTMVAGEDANWGRLFMAAGKTDVPLDLSLLSARIGGILIADKGARLDSYDETPVATHMKGQNIDIELCLGNGPGSATVWTCDLTHGYISINADYRS